MQYFSKLLLTITILFACTQAAPIGDVAYTGDLIARALIELIKRNGDRVFIGWHGTNSVTADFWKSKGKLAKPPPQQGVLDYLGLTDKSSGLTSGADQQLGPGVYVTDDRAIAEAFANNNAAVNRGTHPMVCAIYAKAGAHFWETQVTKVWIPDNLVKDSSVAAQRAADEHARLTYIASVAHGRQPGTTVKLSKLDPGRGGTPNQLVIPSAITEQFEAECVPLGHAAPSGAGALNYQTIGNWGVIRH